MKGWYSYKGPMDWMYMGPMGPMGPMPMMDFGKGWDYGGALGRKPEHLEKL